MIAKWIDIDNGAWRLVVNYDVTPDDMPYIVKQLRAVGASLSDIDRANALFVKDYKFRDIYMLSTAAEEDASACERAVTGLKGWIACFPKSRFAGSVFAGGVTDKGDISGHKALDEAYDLGRNV